MHSDKILERCYISAPHANFNQETARVDYPRFQVDNRYYPIRYEGTAWATLWLYPTLMAQGCMKQAAAFSIHEEGCKTPFWYPIDPLRSFVYLSLAFIAQNFTKTLAIFALPRYFYANMYKCIIVRYAK